MISYKKISLPVNLSHLVQPQQQLPKLIRSLMNVSPSVLILRLFDMMLVQLVPPNSLPTRPPLGLLPFSTLSSHLPPPMTVFTFTTPKLPQLQETSPESLLKLSLQTRKSG
jgi:hypothetical protein